MIDWLIEGLDALTYVQNEAKIEELKNLKDELLTTFSGKEHNATYWVPIINKIIDDRIEKYKAEEK